MGVAKGYKQSAAHIAKRKRSGPANGAWKGDDVSVMGGRRRARAAFADLKSCANCGSTKNLDKHHKDENTLNNSGQNVVCLCRRCHMEADGRLERAKAHIETVRAVGVANAAAKKRASNLCRNGHEYTLNKWNIRECLECRKNYVRPNRRTSPTP